MAFWHLLMLISFSCRYKYFSGINDRFFSTFLFEFNIGFAFGSHLALFALGSIGKDEVLTGVIFKSEGRNPSLFYPLFFGTILTIGSISSLTTAAQKWKGWAKESKRARQINIMINQGQGSKRRNPKQLNNVKYNNPVLGSLVASVVLILFVGLAILHMILTNSKEDQFWFYCSASFLFKTIVPALVTADRKDFRSFIWRSINNTN